MAWYFLARVSLDILVRFLSFTTVALDICPPDNWSPSFGRMWDAYTLRHFWV